MTRLTFVGPIVRLGPNRYSVNDLEAVKTILGLQSALDKSAYYYPFGQADEYNLFSQPSNHAHSKMRRPIAHLYSTSNLLSYEPFVDTCNSILLKRLQEYAEEEKELDVRELMQFYAFDVIGEISVGSRFGLMEDNGDKSGIIKAIDEGTTYSSIIGLVPGWHWWLVNVARLLRMEPSILTLNTYINFHINSRVSGKTKSPEDRDDFLDKMLPLESEGKATRADTRGAVGGNIAAGSDTTAISLSAVVAYLWMNPDTLVKLRQELDEATKRGELSDPATFKEAQKLPYLQAVIMEALRVHPAVGKPLTRVAGQGGLHVAGQYIPPGTEVGVNSWVIHNNEAIFGRDASRFRPERWLTDDPKERAFMERNFISFGTGSRTCIGKNISMLEMSKVIPQIARKFDFEMLRNKETGKEYTWRSRWFIKPDFKCLVKDRAT